MSDPIVIADRCREDFADAGVFQRCFAHARTELARYRQSVEMGGQAVVEAAEVMKFDVRRGHENRAHVAQVRRFFGMLLDYSRDGLA